MVLKNIEILMLKEKIFMVFMYISDILLRPSSLHRSTGVRLVMYSIPTRGGATG